MTLSDIRSNRIVVEWWAAVSAHPNYLAIQQMMHDTHPLRRIQDPPDEANIRLGKIEGYELALQRLHLCSILDEQLELLPEPSFEPPDLKPPPK